MSEQIALGKEVYVDDRKMLVVRIIDHCLSLFEQSTGECYLVKESYAELKAEDGSIAFVTILEEAKPFNKQPSSIKALDPIIWRPKYAKPISTPEASVQSPGLTPAGEGHSNSPVD